MVAEKNMGLKVSVFWWQLFLNDPLFHWVTFLWGLMLTLNMFWLLDFLFLIFNINFWFCFVFVVEEVVLEFVLTDPVGIYLLKVNNRNTRTRCEIRSKLTIKAPEQPHWCRSGVFIVNLENILHLVLVFLFATLNIWMLTCSMYTKSHAH